MKSCMVSSHERALQAQCLLRKCRRRSIKDLHCLFVDLEKADNRVPVEDL